MFNYTIFIHGGMCRKNKKYCSTVMRMTNGNKGKLNKISNVIKQLNN